MNKWIILKSDSDIRFDITPTVKSYETLQLGNVSVYFQRDGRFVSDQLFVSDESRLVVIDGVILNLTELKEKHHRDSIQQLTDCLEATDKIYFQSFIDPFSGLLYHITSDELIVFGNHTGDAPVFYYHRDLNVDFSDEDLISAINIVINAGQEYRICSKQTWMTLENAQQNYNAMFVKELELINKQYN